MICLEPDISVDWKRVVVVSFTAGINEGCVILGGKADETEYALRVLPTKDDKENVLGRAAAFFVVSFWLGD